MSATRAVCETCRFWDTSSESARAQPGTTAACRRRPPAVDDRTGLAMWPYTEESDWCGEHEPGDPA